jgi:hypothetical protein
VKVDFTEMRSSEMVKISKVWEDMRKYSEEEDRKPPEIG